MPPKLLWACPYCLLDTSSGASIAVRELLTCLASIKWEIYILGCTIFDTRTGTLRLKPHMKHLRQNQGKMVNITDGILTHHIIPVKSIDRFELTTKEEDNFFGTYLSMLDSCKPDLVYTYGGHSLDYLIADEAHDRGIPMVSYLANGNYQAQRWCRDVDLIITDSQATSDMYFNSQGFRPVPIGAPINPATHLASEHSRKNVLFVNPSLAKGVAITATLAILMEERRPDIQFEIVESRGNWQKVLKMVFESLHLPRHHLKNVTVTPHTSDMRPVYSRARILLAPSLWWESFGMVAAEAMLNGIPAIVSNRGGLPEVIGHGGISVNFPRECYEAPYTRLIKPELLEPIVKLIERFYDDDAYYATYANQALAESKRYSQAVVMQRFIDAVTPLIEKGSAERNEMEGTHSRKRPNKQVVR